MRFILYLSLATFVSCSWFGSDEPAYKSWNVEQLTSWLSSQGVPLPTRTQSTAEAWRSSLESAVGSSWATATQAAQDQYASAQNTFSSVRHDTFDQWNESRLRQWLLEQGVVSPSGPKEELVMLAKARYREMSNYASLATQEVAAKLDDAKDYAYSTWSDNQLRDYLVAQGALKSKEQKRREELLQMMKSSYAAVANPVWEAWSDSYIRNWLQTHHIISTPPSTREALKKKMSDFYYDTNQRIWDTWSDSDMRQWLVDNNILSASTASQLPHEKLVSYLKAEYANAESTISSTWSESQLRDWLVRNDVIQTSDAEKLQRGELVKLFRTKFKKDPLASSPAPYITWPDARLRAYLVESGYSPASLPSSRQELLLKTTQTWEQSGQKQLLNRVKGMVNDGVERAEDTLAKIWDVMKGYYARGVDSADKTEAQVKERIKEKTEL